MRNLQVSRRFVSSLLLMLLPSLPFLQGCGGGGGKLSGGGTSPVPTVSITSDKSSLVLGDSLTLTITSSNADSCTGTGALSGSVTTNGTLKETPAAAGKVTYGVSCSGSGGSASASVDVTVNAPAVTSVAVQCSPSAITTDQTTTCTETSQGTGNQDVTWSVTGGTYTGSGTSIIATPSGAGTLIAKATSVQNPDVSGSASVTVTAISPTISSMKLGNDTSFFCGLTCAQSIVSINITGTGFKAGYTLNLFGYWPSVTLTASMVSSDGTSIVVPEQFTRGQMPNFVFGQVVPNDGGSPSNTMSVVVIGGYNALEWGQNGSLITDDYGQAYVWTNSNGTWQSQSFGMGADAGLNIVSTVDSSNTLYYVSGADEVDGSTQKLVNGPSPDGSQTSATVAANGRVLFVEPSQNKVLIYNTAPMGQTITATSTIVGSFPYSAVQFTQNGTTDFYVVSVDGTPTLWKVDPSGNILSSVALAGFTSRSDLLSSNHYLGGWPVAVNGAGKGAFVSTADQLMLIFDLTKPLASPISVKLSCNIPVAVDAAPDGTFGVLCAKQGEPSTAGSTFLNVDPATGNPTVSKAFSPSYPLGFRTDANHYYVVSGASAPDVQPK